MSIKRVFKSSIPGNNYLFANGKAAQFIDGRFMTDNEAEIAELEREIKGGIPYIFIDENDYQVDTTMQEEIVAAQNRARQEILAKYAGTVGVAGTPQLPGGKDGEAGVNTPNATSGRSTLAPSSGDLTFIEKPAGESAFTASEGAPDTKEAKEAKEQPKEVVVETAKPSTATLLKNLDTKSSK